MTEDAVAEPSSGFERLKAYYSRHEGRVAAACFAAGFVFDIVTAGRIDSWLTIGQQPALVGTEESAQGQRAAMAPDAQMRALILGVAFDAQPVGLQPPDGFAALQIDAADFQRGLIQPDELTRALLAIAEFEGEPDQQAEPEENAGQLLLTMT